jgi:hypothetical protein
MTAGKTDDIYESIETSQSGHLARLAQLVERSTVNRKVERSKLSLGVCPSIRH